MLPWFVGWPCSDWSWWFERGCLSRCMWCTGQQRGTAGVISKTGHLSSLWRPAFEGGSSGRSPAPLMRVYKSFKGVRTANEASTITIWDVISVVGRMEHSQRRVAQSGPRLPESLRTATAGGWSEWAEWESLEGRRGASADMTDTAADTRPQHYGTTCMEEERNEPWAFFLLKFYIFLTFWPNAWLCVYLWVVSKCEAVKQQIDESFSWGVVRPGMCLTLFTALDNL